MSDFDGSINKIDIYANLRSVFYLIYRGQDNFLAYFKPLNLKSRTLSSNTVTPRKTSIKKWLMCLTSYSAPHVTFSITFVSTVEFQMETYIIYPQGFHFLTTWLGDWWFRLMVLHGTAKKMYKVSKCMCWAIILPSRFFILPRLHCLCRCGLLRSLISAHVRVCIKIKM